MNERIVERDTPIRYAGASQDFNPIHLFDDAAQAAGLTGGVVLHGMCVLAWAAQVCERVAGGPIAEIAARFSAPAQVGDVLRFEVGPDLRGTVVNQRDEEVLRQLRASTTPVDTLTPQPLEITRDYSVGLEKIREFRAAIGVAGPADEAPFTFGAAITLDAVFAAAERRGLPIAGSVHAASRIACSRPLRAGETVGIAASVREDKLKGGLRRVIVESAVIRAGGDPLTLCDWTILRRA